MSIDLVRIDNRLIHGQVLEAWVPYLKADWIVVVDDDSAHDPLKRSILELATPREIRLDIVTIAEAQAMYHRQVFDASGRHVIVLFAGPCQAYRAFQGGFRFRSLNVGNVHFDTGKRRVSHSVCVDEEELGVLKLLARAGVLVELRAVPRESSKQLKADSEVGAFD